MDPTEHQGGEFDDLERLLRSERVPASGEVHARIQALAGRQAARRRPLTVGLSILVTLAAVSLAGLFTVSGRASADRGIRSSTPGPTKVALTSGRADPSHGEYGEIVLVCHHLWPHGPGVTIRLFREQAKLLLRRYPDDFLGPCPSRIPGR